jgi:hypothetical protein
MNFNLSRKATIYLKLCHPRCVTLIQHKMCIYFHIREVKTQQICQIVKGKAVPLRAWSGPEGSRKLRFPDFMTTAQDGGKVVSLMNRPPLPPGNTFLLEAESTAGP